MTTIDTTLGRWYAFDSFGTTREVQEKWRNGARGSDGAPNYQLRTFSYDPTSPIGSYAQVLESSGCDPHVICPDTTLTTNDSASYAYDGVFNLASQTDAGSTIYTTFVSGNRLTAWNSNSYNYDADGNRTYRSGTGYDQTYSWNAAGQLVKVRTAIDSVWYDYDAFGNLLRRKTRGVVDRFFMWDQGQLALQADGAGTTRVAEYAYVSADHPIAVWTGLHTSPYFYQDDGRGSIVGATNGTAIVYNLHYTPWGEEEASGAPNDSTRFGWKSRLWEGGVAQLYYIRSRWYDPTSRAFLSEDPLALAGGLNTYAYAENEPIQGWDPSGAWTLHWGISWRHPWHDVVRAGPVIALIVLTFAAPEASAAAAHGLAPWMQAAEAVGAAGAGSAIVAGVETFRHPDRFNEAFWRDWGIASWWLIASATVVAPLSGGVESVGQQRWTSGFVKTKHAFLNIDELGGGMTLGPASVFTGTVSTYGSHEWGHLAQMFLLSALGKNPWLPYFAGGATGLAGEWGFGNPLTCSWEIAASVLGGSRLGCP